LVDWGVAMLAPSSEHVFKQSFDIFVILL